MRSTVLDTNPDPRLVPRRSVAYSSSRERKSLYNPDIPRLTRNEKIKLNLNESPSKNSCEIYNKYKDNGRKKQQRSLAQGNDQSIDLFSSHKKPKERLTFEGSNVLSFSPMIKITDASSNLAQNIQSESAKKEEKKEKQFPKMEEKDILLQKSPFGSSVNPFEQSPIKPEVAASDAPRGNAGETKIQNNFFTLADPTVIVNESRRTAGVATPSKDPEAQKVAQIQPGLTPASQNLPSNEDALKKQIHELTEALKAKDAELARQKNDFDTRRARLIQELNRMEQMAGESDEKLNKLKELFVALVNYSKEKTQEMRLYIKTTEKLTLELAEKNKKAWNEVINSLQKQKEKMKTSYGLGVTDYAIHLNLHGQPIKVAEDHQGLLKEQQDKYQDLVSKHEEEKQQLIKQITLLNQEKAAEKQQLIEQIALLNQEKQAEEDRISTINKDLLTEKQHVIQLNQNLEDLQKAKAHLETENSQNIAQLHESNEKSKIEICNNNKKIFAKWISSISAKLEQVLLVIQESINKVSVKNEQWQAKIMHKISYIKSKAIADQNKKQEPDQTLLVEALASEKAAHAKTKQLLEEMNQGILTKAKFINSNGFATVEELIEELNRIKKQNTEMQQQTQVNQKQKENANKDLMKQKGIIRKLFGETKLKVGTFTQMIGMIKLYHQKNITSLGEQVIHMRNILKTAKIVPGQAKPSESQPLIEEKGTQPKSVEAIKQDAAIAELLDEINSSFESNSKIIEYIQKRLPSNPSEMTPKEKLELMLEALQESTAENLRSTNSLKDMEEALKHKDEQIAQGDETIKMCLENAAINENEKNELIGSFTSREEEMKQDLNSAQNEIREKAKKIEMLEKDLLEKSNSPGSNSNSNSNTPTGGSLSVPSMPGADRKASDKQLMELQNEKELILKRSVDLENKLDRITIENKRYEQDTSKYKELLNSITADKSKIDTQLREALVNWEEEKNVVSNLKAQVQEMDEKIKELNLNIEKKNKEISELNLSIESNLRRAFKVSKEKLLLLELPQKKIDTLESKMSELTKKMKSLRETFRILKEHQVEKREQDLVLDQALKNIEVRKEMKNKEEKYSLLLKKMQADWNKKEAEYKTKLQTCQEDLNDAESKVIELRDENGDMFIKVEKLNNDVKELNEELKKKNMLLKDYQEKKVSPVKGLRNSGSDLEKSPVKKMHEKWQVEVEKIKAKQAELLKSISNDQADLKRKLTILYDLIKTERTKWLEAVKRAKKEASNKMAELDKQKKENSQLRESFKEQIDKISQETQEKIKSDLESNLAKLQDRIIELEENIKKKDGDIALLQKEKTDLNTTNQKLEKDLAEQVAQHKAASEEKENMQNELLNLKAEITEKEKNILIEKAKAPTNEQQKNIENELAKCKDDIAEKEKEANALKTQISSIAIAHKEEMDKANSANEKKLEELQVQFNSVSAELAENKTAKEKLADDQRNKLEEKNTEVQKLRLQLDELKKEMDLAQEEYKKKEKQLLEEKKVAPEDHDKIKQIQDENQIANEAHKKELEKLRQNNAEIEKLLSNSQKTHQEEIKGMEVKLHQLQEEYNQFKKSSEELALQKEGSIQKLNKSLQEAEEAKAKLNTTIETLQTAREKKKPDVDTPEFQIIQEKLVTAENDKKNADNALQEANKVWEEKMKKCSEESLLLIAKINKIEQDYNKLLEEKNQMKNQYDSIAEQKNKECETLKKSEAEKESELRKTNAELSQKNLEISEIKQSFNEEKKTYLINKDEILKEKEAMTKEIARLEEANKKMENENQSETKASLEAQKALEEKLKKSGEELGLLNKKIKEMTDEANNLKKQLEDEKENLQEEHRKMKEKYEENLAKKDKECEEIKRTHADKEASIASMHQKDMEKIASELKAVQEKLKLAESEKRNSDNAIKESNKALEEKVNKLAAELKAENKKLQEANEEYVNLTIEFKQAAQDKEDIQFEKDQLMKQYEEKFALKQKENESLKKEEAEKKAQYQKEKIELTNKLQTEIEERKAEALKWEKEIKDKNAMSAELSDLKSRLQGFEKEKSSAEKMLHDAQANYEDKIKKLSDELSIANKNLEGADEESNGLRAELKQIDEEKENIKKEMDMMKKEYEAKLLAKTKDYDTLKQTISGKEENYAKEIEELKQKLQEAIKEKEVSEEKQRDYKEEKESMTGKIADLQKELKKMDTEKMKLVNAQQVLNDELAGLNKKLEEANTEFKRTTIESDQKLKAAKEEKKVLEEQKTEAVKKAEKLAEEINTSKEQFSEKIASLTARNQEILADNDKLSKELEKQKRDLEEMNKKLEEDSTLIANVNEKAAKPKEELENVRAENQKVKNDLEELRVSSTKEKAELDKKLQEFIKNAEAEKTNEIASLKKKLEQATNQYVEKEAAMQERLTLLQKEKETMIKDLKKLEQDKNDLVEEKRIAGEEITNLKTEKENIIKENDKSIQEANRTKADLIRLQQEKEDKNIENKKIVEENNKLTTESQKIKAQLEEMKEANLTQNAEEKKASKLINDNAELKEQIRNLEKNSEVTQNNYIAEIRALQKQLQLISEKWRLLKAYVDSTRASYEQTLKETHGALSNSLKNKRLETASQHEKLFKELSDFREESIKKETALQKEIDNANIKYKKLLQDKDDLAIEKEAALQKEKLQLSEELKVAKEEKDSIQRIASQELTKTKNYLSGQIEALNIKYDKLNSDNAEMVKEVNKYKIEKDQLVEGYEKKVLDLQKENEKMLNEKVNSEEDHKNNSIIAANLQKQLSEVKLQWESTKEELSKMRTLYENTLNEHRSKISTAITEANQKPTELLKTEEKLLNSMKIKCQDLAEQNENLQKEIASLKEELMIKNKQISEFTGDKTLQFEHKQKHKDQALEIQDTLYIEIVSEKRPSEKQLMFQVKGITQKIFTDPVSSQLTATLFATKPEEPALQEEVKDIPVIITPENPIVVEENKEKNLENMFKAPNQYLEEITSVIDKEMAFLSQKKEKLKEMKSAGEENNMRRLSFFYDDFSLDVNDPNDKKEVEEANSRAKNEKHYQISQKEGKDGKEGKE